MSTRKRESALSRWTFTWNNYEESPENIEKFKAWIQGPDTKMAIVGMETAPTTGMKHLQGYIELSKRRRLTELKKICDKIHWEGANGTRTQNYQYCSKDGNIWYEKKEGGDWNTSRSQDDLWQRVVKLAREGELETIEAEAPAIWTRYRGALEKMTTESIIASLKIYDGELSKKNIWIWGPPGVGKSKWANSQYDVTAIYRKMANKWWDGYNIRVHKMILIEDWPHITQLDMGHHMKVWSDRYPFQAESKGGMVCVDPEVHIVVTSNYPISECFKPTDVPAIKRRFTEIEMTPANQILVNSMNFE